MVQTNKEQTNIHFRGHVYLLANLYLEYCCVTSQILLKTHLFLFGIAKILSILLSNYIVRSSSVCIGRWTGNAKTVHLCLCLFLQSHQRAQGSTTVKTLWPPSDWKADMDVRPFCYVVNNSHVMRGEGWTRHETWPLKGCLWPLLMLLIYSQ